MFELTSRRLLTPGRLVFGVGLLGLMAAVQANAACMDGLKKMAPQAANSGDFQPAVYHPDERSGAGFIRVDDSQGGPSIVGLWKFQESGFLKDFGTQAFHLGGTETMFSAGVDPETGDVCQGVWRRVGYSTFTLNHIAMAWTAPGAGYGLLIHIHMLIKLAPSGNAFTGTYTVSLFPATAADPFDESGGPMVTGSGTIAATRLLPD